MSFYTVIGLGRFGSRLALALSSREEDVLVIDRSETLVDQMANQVTQAAVADAKNKDALRGLGVQDSDCAIVAIGSDLAASVLITMNLKALGVKKIICKAHDDLHREILEKLGANQVIIPERAMADKLAASLTEPDVLEYISLSHTHGIMEMNAPAEWQGKTLRELSIRTVFGITVIAVRTGADIQISPAADYRIAKGDILIVLGESEALDNFKENRF